MYNPIYMGLSNMYNPYTISILFKIFVLRIIITRYGKSYWPSGTKERQRVFNTLDDGQIGTLGCLKVMDEGK